MEYQAVLTLNILSEDGTRCAVGQREITLPFPPYVGLEITEQWRFGFTLKSVIWSIDDQRFHCGIEERERDADDTFLDMEFLISEAKECGFVGFKKVVDLKLRSDC